MWFEPKREPDELIPPTGTTYMNRWFILRKNRFFGKLLENCYLHHILRSDDDRALHDHPWWNISIVLRGGYYEEMPLVSSKDYRTEVEFFGRGYTRKEWRGVGSIIFRRATDIHRLEVPQYPLEPTWTLFITGRKTREWGFWCPRKGFVHHKRFGERGCE